jgi:hypothetical protein
MMGLSEFTKRNLRIYKMNLFEFTKLNLFEFTKLNLFEFKNFMKNSTN